MRGRALQLALLPVIAFLIAAAGFLQQPIRENKDNPYDLARVNRVDIEGNPDLAAMTLIPGGLRVVALNWLWIKMTTAHQEGRHHDAYELSRLICKLEPYYPGAWAYCSWNMAWNVSVETHTREERWQWVYNGLKLLRDEAIPKNPRSIVLYYELGWIFAMKLGGRLDNYHWAYKQKWARMMQDLLGAPPFQNRLDVSLEESTGTALSSFRPIAEAPLDKSSGRRGREIIQADKLELVMRDPAVKEYADALAKYDIFPDRTFMDAYNRFTMDFEVASVRAKIFPELKDDRDKAVFDLINDQSRLLARAKILSFLRAQILWNKYGMDPAYMLELMERYRIPLDWRHTLSHALYWYCRGLDYAEWEDPTKFKVRKIHRNILNCLKSLTFTGQLNIRLKPGDGEYAEYEEYADLRFVIPSHEQHVAFIDEYRDYQAREKEFVDDFDKNIFAAGHYNYLATAICLLTADGRVKDGQYLLDYVKRKYNRYWEDWWDPETAEEFTENYMRTHKKIYGLANAMVNTALKRSLLALGLRGDRKEFAGRLEYALMLYRIYNEAAVSGRLVIPAPFRSVMSNIVMTMITRPEDYRLRLPPDKRSDLYLAVLAEDRKLTEPPGILAPVYLHGRPFLETMCGQTGMDMAKAFPEPPYLDEYRRAVQARIRGSRPTDGRVIEERLED